MIFRSLSQRESSNGRFFFRVCKVFGASNSFDIYIFKSSINSFDELYRSAEWIVKDAEENNAM